MPGPFLDFDPDPAVWIVGPTPDRPTEVWLPAATEVKAEFFGLGPEQTAARETVRDVLGSTARRHPSPLPYFLMRWREMHAVPVTVFLGLVDRTEDPELPTQWLDAADALPLEPPVVDTVATTSGAQVRRSLVYALDEDASIIVSLRYLVDTGHPAAFLLAHAASDVAAEMLEARDDLDALMATVTISDEPGAAPGGTP